MEVEAKFFEELTTAELFEILKARSAVFVVEQNCIYQDMNDLDYRSLHVFAMENGSVLAYLRAFVKDAESRTVQIGRVLTMQRGRGFGMQILETGIRLAAEKLHADRIFVEAQSYAVGFYEKAGFQVCSDAYLDDGIPHVDMVKNL